VLVIVSQAFGPVLTIRGEQFDIRHFAAIARRSDGAISFLGSAVAGWWALLAATWRRMSKDSLSILAAGIAFQTFFSLFPTLTATPGA